MPTRRRVGRAAGRGSDVDLRGEPLGGGRIGGQWVARRVEATDPGSLQHPQAPPAVDGGQAVTQLGEGRHWTVDAEPAHVADVSDDVRPAVEPAGVGEADGVVQHGELVEGDVPGPLGDVGTVGRDAADPAQGSQAGVDLVIVQDPRDLPQVRHEELRRLGQGEPQAVGAVDRDGGARRRERRMRWGRSRPSS